MSAEIIRLDYSCSDRREPTDKGLGGQRFCSAAFCQALTAFFAVRPIVLSC
jgi:hypothetical protein